MPPIHERLRRVHHKCKTGCDQCKLRKVKCGEEKPICRNCIKRKKQCSFLPPGATNPDTFLAPSGQTGTGRVLYTSSIPAAPTSFMDLATLELWYHFTVHTCMTFSSRPLIRTLWQTTAPLLGLEADFVLRAMLAVSGLHLARLVPEKSQYYTIKAIEHHQSSSRIAAPLMATFDPENTSKLFLFSVLTSFFALASTPHPNASVPAWIFLIQGTRKILDRKFPFIKEGPLGPMLIDNRSVKLLTASPSQGENFELLEHLLTESALTGQLHVDGANVCSIALQQLASSFTVAYTDDPDSPADYFRQVLAWPHIVPGKYIDMVQNHVPEALCIFGHYCVLLQKLESSWYMAGRSKQLMSTIHSLLDDCYRQYIRWPAQEIGWTPV